MIPFEMSISANSQVIDKVAGHNRTYMQYQITKSSKNRPSGWFGKINHVIPIDNQPAGSFSGIFLLINVS
jgi:hypothetical protein